MRKAALAKSDVKIEAEYTIPIEHHNAMEPHAAIAMWEGDKLMVFDKTQGVGGVQDHLAAELWYRQKKMFRLCPPFVGGAFGSALMQITIPL